MSQAKSAEKGQTDPITPESSTAPADPDVFARDQAPVR